MMDENLKREEYMKTDRFEANMTGDKKNNEDYVYYMDDSYIRGGSKEDGEKGDDSYEHRAEESTIEYNNKPERKKKGSGRIGLTAALLSLCFLISCAGAYLGNYLYNNSKSGGIMQNTPAITINSDDRVNVVEAVSQKVLPSVVGITAEMTQEDIFGMKYPAQSVGSGVIIDKRGYIITNAHVITDENTAGASKSVNVVLYDKSSKKAKVLWLDRGMDLAVIKIDGDNYPTAELGDSDKVNIGETAIAIGNPLGLDFNRTVTSGIISGKNRTITLDNGQVVENLLQTDASINRGNSGGPLLNSKGQVIGINTIKISSAEGLGFALPINMVKNIAQSIIQTGKVQKGYLGVSAYSVSEYSKALGLKLPSDKGVIIVYVDKNSSAEKAGLLPGDIIVKIDDKAVDSKEALTKMLYNYKVGDKVNIEILRNGVKKDINLTFYDVKDNNVQ